MNSFRIAAALAGQHRTQLQAEAQQYRLARLAKTGSSRQTVPTRRPRALRWLTQSLRPTA
jgi:hypothetical protein